MLSGKKIAGESSTDSTPFNRLDFLYASIFSIIVQMEAMNEGDIPLLRNPFNA